MPVAEQSVFRQVHIRQLDVAGPSAAEACIVADRKALRLRRSQEQADPAGRTLMVMDMRGDDDLIGGMAVEHSDLAAGEAPALCRLVRDGRDLGQIKPCRALGMG